MVVKVGATEAAAAAAPLGSAVCTSSFTVLDLLRERGTVIRATGLTVDTAGWERSLLPEDGCTGCRNANSNGIHNNHKNSSNSAGVNPHWGSDGWVDGGGVGDGSGGGGAGADRGGPCVPAATAHAEQG